MPTGVKSWSHFSHQADIGLSGSGPTLEAAFEQVAVAMTGVITDPVLVEPQERVDVHCEAPDRELLLVEWLNALIFEMATRGMLFARYEVHIEGDRLNGAAWGEPVSRERHKPAVEIKGATYTALAVQQDENGSWTARCVVDV